MQESLPAAPSASPSTRPAPTDLVAVGRALQQLLDPQMDTGFYIEDLSRISTPGIGERYRFVLGTPGPDGNDVETPYLLDVLDPQSNRNVMAIGLLAAKQLPVPLPRWHEPDARAFGAPALVSEFPPGQALATARLTADELNSVLTDLARALAAWHGAPAEAETRGHAEQPPAPPRLEKLQHAWRGSGSANDPLMALAYRWLDAHAPVDAETVLIHGPFHDHDIYLNAAGPQLSGVMGWQNAAVGDRHEDLASLLLRDTLAPSTTELQMASSRARARAIIAAYEVAADLRLDRDRLDYYSRLCLWREALDAARLIDAAGQQGQVNLDRLDTARARWLHARRALWARMRPDEGKT
jgi:hypothetical protein